MKRADLELLAKKIADSNAPDLTDEVVKVANDKGLSASAAQSLSHMVNTMVSVRHLEKKAGRESNFKLAEPVKVVKALAGRAADKFRKTASADMSDWSRPFTMEKQASDSVDEDIELARARARQEKLANFVQHSADYNRIARTKGHLNILLNHRAALEREFSQEKVAMVTCFRLLDNTLPFESFARGAVSLHGDKALSILSKIAQEVYSRYDPALERIGSIKTASVAHMIVDTSHPAFAKLAHMLEMSEAYDKLNSTIAAVKAHLEQ